MAICHAKLQFWSWILLLQDSITFQIELVGPVLPHWNKSRYLPIHMCKGFVNGDRAYFRYAAPSLQFVDTRNHSLSCCIRACTVEAINNFILFLGVDASNEFQPKYFWETNISGTCVFMNGPIGFKSHSSDTFDTTDCKTMFFCRTFSSKLLRKIWIPLGVEWILQIFFQTSVSKQLRENNLSGK